MRLKMFPIYILMLLVFFGCVKERQLNEVGVFHYKSGLFERDKNFETINGIFPDIGIYAESIDSVVIYVRQPLKTVDNDSFPLPKIFLLEKKGRNYDIINELDWRTRRDTNYFKIDSRVKFFALKEFNYKVFKIKVIRSSN